MYNVTITKSAENDLRGAVSYIADNLLNKAAANRLADKAENLINSLSDSPLRHPLVNDEFLADLGIRQLFVNKYIVFYIVNEETESVSVVRFLHSRRDWINILNDNCEDTDDIETL